MSITTASQPTKTELEAIQRRRAFHQKIAKQAAALEEAKRSPCDIPAFGLKAESFPAETDPPRRKVWFSIVDELPTSHPSILEIQIVVSNHFGTTTRELKSHRRNADAVYARHIAVYLCKEFTPFSFPNIAKHFGGKDHTVMLYAWRKIARLTREDWLIAHDVAKLTEEVTGVQQ